MSEAQLLFVVLRDHIRASTRAHREIVLLVFAMIFGLVISKLDLSLTSAMDAAIAGALVAVVGVILVPAAIFLVGSLIEAKQRREPLARYVGSQSYRDNLDSSLRF